MGEELVYCNKAKNILFLYLLPDQVLSVLLLPSTPLIYHVVRGTMQHIILTYVIHIPLDDILDCLC